MHGDIELCICITIHMDTVKDVDCLIDRVHGTQYAEKLGTEVLVLRIHMLDCVLLHIAQFAVVVCSVVSGTNCNTLFTVLYIVNTQATQCEGIFVVVIDKHRAS